MGIRKQKDNQNLHIIVILYLNKISPFLLIMIIGLVVQYIVILHAMSFSMNSRLSAPQLCLYNVNSIVSFQMHYSIRSGARELFTFKILHSKKFQL